MTILTDINKQYLSRAGLASVLDSMKARSVVGAYNQGFTSTLTSSSWTTLNIDAGPALTLSFTATTDDLAVVCTVFGTSHSLAGNFAQWRHELNGAPDPNITSMSFPVASTGGADQTITLFSIFTAPVNGVNVLRFQGRNGFGTGTVYYSWNSTKVLILRRQ
jgi:hypothetical protein